MVAMTETSSLPIDPSLAKEMDSLIAASEIMLETAKMGDWDQVVHLEAERRSRVDHLFANPDLQDIDAHRLCSFIEHLIQLDQNITLLGQATRDEVADKLGEMNAARHAASAYQSNKSLK